MHDTQRIVRNAKGQSALVFVEVMFFTFLDVVPFDFNVLVSIGTTLNMVHTKGMDEFMHDSAI